MPRAERSGSILGGVRVWEKRDKLACVLSKMNLLTTSVLWTWCPGFSSLMLPVYQFYIPFLSNSGEIHIKLTILKWQTYWHFVPSVLCNHCLCLAPEHFHQPSTHWAVTPHFLLPPALASTNLSLWIYSFWIFNTHGIVQYVTFCVWLPSS